MLLFTCIYLKGCRAGRVAQVVEHLPSKHKTLNSNHSTEKKKKNWAGWGHGSSGRTPEEVGPGFNPQY
jgi:hypothetical protein